MIEKFLIYSSGSNVSIVLEHCQLEKSKHIGIGATVFFTGLLAAISAAYAMYSVFDSILLSLTFGIIWGLLIYNLDKYIVSTMKSGYTAIPRILLAILLAIVISKPLELKIFEKEINTQLDLSKQEQLTDYKIKSEKSFPELIELNDKIKSLKKEIVDKENFRNEKQREYDAERFGTKSGLSSGVPGLGKNAKIKELQLLSAEKQLELVLVNNTKSIGQLESKYNSIDSIKKVSVNASQTNIDNYNGLASKIEALDKLSDKNLSIKLAVYFVTFLFIVIEILPVLTKVMSPNGYYEFYVRNKIKSDIKRLNTPNYIAESNDYSTLMNRIVKAVESDIIQSIKGNANKVMGKRKKYWKW